MTLMTRGATWLGARLQTAAGRSVTYRRGISSSSPIVGWVNRHQVQEVGDDGLLVAVTMDDWTFVWSELLIGGSQITPRAGDQIVEGVTVFEVLPTKDDECFERFDAAAGGQLIRIHTKRVGS